MTVTLAALRQRVGELLEDAYVGTATGGTTSTVVCATFPIRDSVRDTIYRYAAVVRPGAAATGDIYRRVTTDAPSTGTLTVDTNYTNAPVNGDSIELWRVYDPSRVVRHANRVMERLRFLEEINIVGVDNQRQYVLSDYTWLTNPAQVIALLRIDGNVALQYTFSETGWRITQDTGALVLHLTGATVTSADSLRLRALRDYFGAGQLSLQTDVTNAPLVWLAYEVALDMLTMPAVRRGTDMDPVSPLAVEEIRGHALYWRRWFRDRLAESKPLFAPSQRAWGPVRGTASWGG